MGKKEEIIHYTVRVKEELSKLFSIRTSSDGSIVLILNHAKNYKDLDYSNSIFDGKKLKEQHYSIHPSSHLPESVIKHTLQFEDEKLNALFKKQYTFDRHYTFVLKNKMGIAPLFCRLCPDLSAKSSLEDGYQLNDEEKKGKIIELAHYNPETTTLFYFLFVSHVDYPFLNSKKNVHHFVIKDRRISFLWSEINSKSSQDGKLAHLSTMNGQPMRIQHGYDSNQVMQLFDDFKNGAVQA